MTPERKAYAEKRIQRLSAKIGGTADAIGQAYYLGLKPKQVEELKKSLVSSQNARRRWIKELRAAGHSVEGL